MSGTGTGTPAAVSSGYCTLAEAMSLLPTVGTLRDAATGPPAVTATVPMATQGAALLAAVCAEIDMHLRGRGYTVPLTDADGLASLKTIAMYGVAATVAKAKWPADSGAGGDAGAAKTWADRYAKGLADIDGGMLAPDADTSSATSFADGFDHDIITDSDGYRSRAQRTPPF